MNQPHVGFYVHYHGLGHKHRTEAILEHLELPSSVITSRIESLPWNGKRLQEVVGIACDIDNVSEPGKGRAADVSALHYAPLWTDNCTTRVAQYTAWLNQQRPAVVVVDVSVEISMLTRIASIPQIVMRQHGDRSDAPHLAAYEAAEALLAPFPESMEDDITPEWVREKTRYLHGFCRHEQNSISCQEARNQLGLDDKPTVVAMLGRGGASNAIHHLSAAAAATPGYRWIVVGLAAEDVQNAGVPTHHLQLTGWIDDPTLHLKAADVVVTAAGHNSVMEAGFHRCKMIAVAQERPFGEQLRKSIVLDREGLAVGLRDWPQASTWPELIEQAGQLDSSRWDAIFVRDGARQAAEIIEDIAEESWTESGRTRQTHASCSQTIQESIR